MSHNNIIKEENIWTSLDEISNESDDEFITDFFVNFDESDEEEIASKQDIGTVQGDVHEYTVFHQSDKTIKTEYMSDTEQPDTEEETEVSIPTHQPKYTVFHQNDKTIKAEYMSDTEQPDTEEETEVSIPTHRPKYTVFHQNDKTIKTEYMSDTEQPDTEEETEVSIPTHQPKYTVFHQNDKTIKTKYMSDTEQPDTEEETEVSIPTQQPKVIVPRKINKCLFTPNFKWKSGTPFQPKVHRFYPSKSGIQKEFELNSNSSILDFFEAFVTPFLLGKVAYYTNQYYRQHTESDIMSCRNACWYDTTSEELYLFISVQMLMTRSNKLDISEYWSTDPLLSSPIFGKIMSGKRFQILLRYIHFSNNKNQVTDDRLFKIDMVLQDIKNRVTIFYLAKTGTNFF